MKKILLILLLISFGGLINAQTVSNTATNDTELNSILKDINLNAKADIKLFKKNLSLDFNVTEGKIDQLMVSYDMQPADLYMSFQVSKQTGKSVEDVADCYKKNKGKGWGAIAKEMGIKPGSKEFHALKDNAKGKNTKMKEEKGAKGKGGKGKGGKDKGKKK